ncbi:MAG: hypothetical protein Q7R78_00285 [bacterium]|nr:hypothetical protein [bacterium]
MKTKKSLIIKTNKSTKSRAQSVLYKPSAYLREAIAEGEKEYKEGKTKTYSSVEEMIKALKL